MLEALLEIQKRKKNELLERMLGDLRATDARFSGEALEVWGPVDAFQYDLRGTTPIHKFTTLLVRLADRSWFFVRQAFDLTDDPEAVDSKSCYVSKVHDHEAEAWRNTNRLHAPVLPAARS